MNTRRLFALVATLICTAALCAAQTQAASNIIDSGYCGEDPNLDDDIDECGENLSWTLTDDGVLTIFGSGKMCTNDNRPWKDLQSIRQVVIQDGVTSIGDAAFAYCRELTELTIGENVTLCIPYNNNNDVEGTNSDYNTYKDFADNNPDYCMNNI